MGGTAQTQAYEGRQAQTEAALTIGQDLGVLGQRWLADTKADLRREPDRLQIQIRNARVVKKAGEIRGLEICPAANAR